MEVEGISALTESSISVQGRGGIALTCAIPTGAVLTGFAVGDESKWSARSAPTAPSASRELESETAEFEFEIDEDDENEDDENEDDE